MTGKRTPPANGSRGPHPSWKTPHDALLPSWSWPSPPASCQWCIRPPTECPSRDASVSRRDSAGNLESEVRPGCIWQSQPSPPPPPPSPPQEAAHSTKRYTAGIVEIKKAQARCGFQDARAGRGNSPGFARAGDWGSFFLAHMCGPRWHFSGTRKNAVHVACLLAFKISDDFLFSLITKAS